VPHEELLPAARRLAERLTRAAPLAARATKEVAMRSQHLPMLEAIRFGETMRKVAAGTADAAEGMRAAVERRPPVWTGR
jgi:enoyl-CoA hydratase/carnithine racemase